jgi:hypothetical protein
MKFLQSGFESVEKKQWEQLKELSLPLPNYLHIGRLRTLGTLGNFTFNFIPLLQGFESFALNGRKVDEYVLSVFRCYEPITLLLIEPFNLTLHL